MLPVARRASFFAGGLVACRGSEKEEGEEEGEEGRRGRRKKEDERATFDPRTGLYVECVCGVIKIILWKKRRMRRATFDPAYGFVRRMRAGV